MINLYKNGDPVPIRVDRGRVAELVDRGWSETPPATSTAEQEETSDGSE